MRARPWSKSTTGSHPSVARAFDDVERVAEVVAGAVGDEADARACVAGEALARRVDEVAQARDEGEVLALDGAAEGVALARLAAGEREEEATRVIVDVEPLAPLRAVAVDGDLAAGDRAADAEGRACRAAGAARTCSSRA